MLVRTVFPPTSLDEVPSEEMAARLYCSTWLLLLQHIVENGILIDTCGDSLGSSYYRAVSKWPIKFRKRAQEMMAALKTRNRITTPTSSSLNARACTDATCRPYLAAGMAVPDYIIVAREACRGCQSLAKIGFPGTFISEFAATKFVKRFARARSWISYDGEHDTDRFEKDVLIPLLTNAKIVKIFDRWIGRSMLNNGGVIAQNYESTLIWVLKTYLRVANDPSGASAEIHCGIEPRKMRSVTRFQIQASIQAMETKLASIGISAKFILYNETPQHTCAHGRYLITDQAALLIERGFDLLWDDNRMRQAGFDPTRDPRRLRDTAVFLEERCRGVEQQTKRLPMF